MLLKIVGEIAQLTLIIATLYLALGAYARKRQPTWLELLERHRLGVLVFLVLGVLATKISEDALSGESGPIDQSIMLFVRHYVPVGMTGFFEAASFTGSSTFLLPLTILVAIALLWRKCRFEALLIITSVLSAATIVYVLKTVVGRARPTLWATDWYWGSSFPSGHTLVVAAFATSAALCASRLRPAYHEIAMPVALVWILLVGVSRLVLGVHWPTDVLAAACIGAFLLLVMALVLKVQNA